MSQSFNPDWASPPGRTVQELINQKGICEDEFRNEFNMSINEFNDLINGKYFIDEEFATRLSEYLGGSRQFWINRENQYREDKKSI